ncbi:MAG: hypothetical protein ABJO09_01385 [Hyphomicrobiales bacterium]
MRDDLMLNAAGLEAARKFTAVLERTQYYPPERMQAYQRNLLEPLLRHARAEVPFYKKRLDPLFDRNDEIRWEAWVDIPTVARKDAQEAGEGMFARNLPKHCGVVENGQTSGSTGRPLKFRTNSLMRLLKSAVGEQIFNWHHVNQSKTAAFMVDFKMKHQLPDGTKGSFWNITKPESRSFQLSLGYTIEEQVKWLLQTKPQVLTSYPSNAAATLKYFQDHDITPPFDTIVCHGECLSGEVKRTLTSDNNINIVDRFGASEIGPISAACPENPDIHHQFSEINLVENLEYESDRAQLSGTGRMVITPFYNYAMPLIRYENHDFIETSDEQCNCGRTLPIIKRIYGRRRNLFKFANGKIRWPNFDVIEFIPFLPAHQFQFIQKTETHIDVVYVHDGSSREPDADKLKAYMQQKLNEEFEIALFKKTEIPQLPSRKFEDCISLVE